MFGVVPKTLWSKQVPADERNRIRFAMRSLLVEHPDGLVLIETGLGNKEDQKFIDIYGAENAGTGGGTLLDDALAEVGFQPEDVKWVVNTHLHFDHAGGNTRGGEGGRAGGREARRTGGGVGAVRPPARPGPSSWPSPTPPTSSRRTSSSSPATPTSGPARATCRTTSSRWTRRGSGGCSRATRRSCPGSPPASRRATCRGTRASCSRSGGETLIYLGDIIPTRHHLPLVYIMGYDLEPLRSLETKRASVADALRERVVAALRARRRYRDGARGAGREGCRPGRCRRQPRRRTPTA